MGESFLIMLREGFEATLVVAIVFAYLRRIDRMDLSVSVWAGVAAAVAIATTIGVGIHLTTGSLTGDARLITFALIAIGATIVLTWMIFWMARQSRAIKGELEHKIDAALHHDDAAVGRAVALVAFTAVLREGIEAALFIVALSIDADGLSVVIGALLGIVIAAVLGWAIYMGGRAFPMRTFFRITGVVLIVFAAGLCAKAVLWLQLAGVLGTWNNAVYNLTGIHWLTQDSEVGKFLAGLFGWDPRPSFEQVVAWLGYFIPVTVLFLWGDDIKRRLKQRDEPRPEVPQRVPA